MKLGPFECRLNWNEYTKLSNATHWCFIALWNRREFFKAWAYHPEPTICNRNRKPFAFWGVGGMTYYTVGWWPEFCHTFLRVRRRV